MLDRHFTATLHKSLDKGGWTYVVWPKSAEFFGTKGLVKAEIRQTIGKEAGEIVVIHLQEQI